MTTKYIVGGSICLFLALTPGTSHAAPVKVGNYVIPSAFARSLEQGNDGAGIYSLQRD